MKATDHRIYRLSMPVAWGYIPSFLNSDDPRPAREQFGEGYIAGWRPFKGFDMHPKTHELRYPDDPTMKPIDKMKFRDELIILYPYSWVAIVQKDGTFEVSRMD